MDWMETTRDITREVGDSTDEELEIIEEFIRHWLQTIELERRVRGALRVQPKS